MSFIEHVDEKQFQTRILKLNYLLEKCENHKQLEPTFSLYFNELTETIREIRGGNNDKYDDSISNMQSSFGKISHFGMFDAAGGGVGPANLNRDDSRGANIRGQSADGKIRIHSNSN